MQVGQPLLVVFELLLVFLAAHLLVELDLEELLDGLQRKLLVQRVKGRVPVQRGPAMVGLLLERFLDGCTQRVQAVDLRLFAVGGVDQVPGGKGEAGRFKVIFKILQTGFIVLVLPAVVLADPPGGVRVVQQALDALVLLLFADVQKELDQQVAVVEKLPLKDADLLQPSLVVLVIKLTALPLAHRLVHPAGIEKQKFPVFRDLLHVPVQKRAGLLLGGGRLGGNYLEKAGVHLADHGGDAAALAGGAPALHQHDDRQIVLLDRKLQRFHPLRQAAQLLLFLLFGERGFRKRKVLQRIFLVQHKTLLTGWNRTIQNWQNNIENLGKRLL